jgi:hypothetical protein
VEIAIGGAGLFFLVAGIWSVLHAERRPETPAAGWLSYPSGRRVGGALTALVGAAAVILGLTQR